MRRLVIGVKEIYLVGFLFALMRFKTSDVEKAAPTVCVLDCSTLELDFTCFHSRRLQIALEAGDTLSFSRVTPSHGERIRQLLRNSEAH